MPLMPALGLNSVAVCPTKKVRNKGRNMYHFYHGIAEHAMQPRHLILVLELRIVCAQSLENTINNPSSRKERHH